MMILKFLKHFFLGLLIVLLSLSAVLMGAAYFLRDKVKAIVIKEINQQVTVPVEVKGSIDFSLLKNFPYASLTFHGVTIKNKLHGGPEYLLDVQEFSFLFNTWALLHDKFEISRVHAYDGSINVYLDAHGNADFDILKPSASKDTSASSSGMNIDLRKAVVKNMMLTYLTENKEEDIRLDIEKFDLSGRFSDERYDLSADGKMMIQLLRLNGETYLTQKPFDAGITIDVDQKQSKFTFNKGYIEIAKSRFDMSGYFISSKKSTYVNFSAKTKGKDISNLIALIPLKFKSSLAGTEGKGAFDVEAKISGSIRTHVNPMIEVTAVLSNAEIQLPKIKRSLTKVSTDCYYRMDSTGDDALIVRRFHSEFDGYPQTFSLRLTHLSEPDIVLDADGTADLHELKSFFTDSTVQSAQGTITFHSFHFEGSKRDMDRGHNENLRASGDFELKKVEIVAGGITYTNINGGLQYHDRIISIKNFSLNFLNTDFVFDGHVTNLITYAVSQNNRDNPINLPLGVEGTLHMKSLDLNTIMKAYSGNSKPAHAASPASSSPLNAKAVFNITGHLMIGIDKFVYGHMSFDHIQADLGLSPYRMDINSLSTQAMGGTLLDSGYIAFNDKQQMVMLFDLSADKIDLPTLFRQADNFGQTTLTDKNLKGTLSAGAQVRAVYNNYKDIDLDQLRGHLTCTVSRGELNNFAPLRSASAFIKMDELNHIVFSDLSNELEIKDRMITIPRMEIQSSAVNLIMAGTHSLDNIIDYQIKVNLRKLLAAKFGRKENDDTYIEENPYEGVNLYLRITGDINALQIKYDKQSVKKKLKADLTAQKEELKELFGKGKKKAKGEEGVKLEEKYYDTRKKPEFIDFQDDTTK